MPGAQYIALSGLRARADQLDRLASDIANIGTTGYKGQRSSYAAATRNEFEDALQTAVDTTSGSARLDTASGVLADTGRPLDVAIDGKGFFAVQTAAGTRYTRNGHFTRNSAGQLTTEDGSPVLGDNGPIQLADGAVRVDKDGTVWAGDTQAGKLSLVSFADAGQLTQEGTSLLNAGSQTATPDATASVRGGALEQSNVSVAERIADLTSVSRGYEALQKSLSLMMNDVDGKAIDQLGRR